MNKLFFIEEFKSKNIFKSLPYCLTNTSYAITQTEEFKKFAKLEISELLKSTTTSFAWKDYKKLDALHQACLFIINSLDLTYDFKNDAKIKEASEEVWEFLTEYIYDNARIRTRLTQLKASVSNDTQKQILTQWLTTYISAPNNPKNKKITSTQEKIGEIATTINDNITSSMKDPKHCYVVAKKDIQKLKGISLSQLKQGYKNALDLGLSNSFLFPPHATKDLLTCLKMTSTRKEVYQKYLDSNTKKQKFNNNKLLTDLIKNKQKLAQLKNKENYCELVTENYLIKNRDDIQYFLQQTIDTLEPFYNKTLEEIKAIAEADGFKKLNVWDIPYFKARLKKMKFDSIEAQYEINMENAIEQIIKLFKEKFNLTITEVIDQKLQRMSKGAIQTFTLKDNTTGREGYLMLDLYTDIQRKEGGYYLCETLRSNFSQGNTKANGVYYVRGNFAKNKKSQVLINSIVALMHELGHAMQGFYAQYSDPMLSSLNDLSWDLIELPSQFMEQFMYDPNIVVKFMKPRRATDAWKTKSDAMMLIESTLWLENFFTLYGNLHINLKQFDLFNSFKPYSTKIVSEVLTENIKDKFYLNPNNDYFLCDKDYKTDYGPTKYSYLLNDIMAYAIYQDQHKEKNVDLETIYRKVFSSISNEVLHAKLKNLINFSTLDINSFLCRGQKFVFFKPTKKERKSNIKI